MESNHGTCRQCCGKIRTLPLFRNCVMLHYVEKVNSLAYMCQCTAIGTRIKHILYISSVQ